VLLLIQKLGGRQYPSIWQSGAKSACRFVVPRIERKKVPIAGHDAWANSWEPLRRFLG